MLKVLSVGRYENEKLMVRSLVVPGLTVLFPIITSADFDTLSQGQEMSPYVLRLMLRSILSSASPDRALLAAAIDRDSRLQELRPLLQ